MCGHFSFGAMILGSPNRTSPPLSLSHPRPKKPEISGTCVAISLATSSTHTTEIFMKNIALMSLVTLLVSCNGSGGGSHSTGQGPASSESASAFTTDHYEKYLRSLKAGMTSETTSTEPSYFVNDEGQLELEMITAVSQETILKIDGDLIYTLEVSDSEGDQAKLVHIRSMEEMVRNNKKLMKYTVSGNIVTQSYSSSDSWTLEGINGEEIALEQEQSFRKTFTLGSYECPATTKGTYKTKATIDGKPVKLPASEFVSQTNCGEMLKKKDLKKIDLTEVFKCDSTESQEEEYECTEETVDMSDLLN